MAAGRLCRHTHKRVSDGRNRSAKAAGSPTMLIALEAIAFSLVAISFLPRERHEAPMV
jgi:hypothetical protein